MSVATIEAMREERATAYERMKEINDLALEERRDLTAEEQQEYDNVEREFDDKSRSIERTERLEGIAPRMPREVAAAVEEAREREIDPERDAFEHAKEYRTWVAHEDQRSAWDDNEYRDQFWRFLRTGQVIDRGLVGRIPQEVRVQSKASGAAGANLVPEEFGDLIRATESEFGVMEQLARVITTDGGEKINFPTSTAHGTATWTAENASYTASDETFGTVAVDAYKLGRIVLVSEELLVDSAFDLERYLAEQFGESFGIAKNTAFWVGDGSGKPTGLSTRTTAGVRLASGNVATIPTDALFDLQHSIKPGYRANATWVVNDQAFKALRKAKDTTNQYLWQPGLQAGSPDTLLGRPILVDPDVPVPEASAKTVFYGDFSRAYLVRNANGISIQRLVEKYADNGQVGFRAYQRTDGNVVNTEAVKHLQQSAT